MLHRLEVGDRLAELFPLPRIADRVVERALREPDHLRSYTDAPLVQRFNRHLVSLADFAEDVGARDATVVEQ